jgi:hypothetical protein
LNFQLLKALARDPEARRKEGLVLVEGPKAAAEALKAGSKVKVLFLTPFPRSAHPRT